MQEPIIKGNSIIVPSDTRHLADVDMFVEGILRGWKINDSTIADIAISVSELVNNAISHGNETTSSLSVKVLVTRKNSDVLITVVDEGTGFNPEEIEDPIADNNLLKEVGRGIFIVRSLMDKVDIDATDKGTTITITKKIA